jgi:hypothetical protein
MELETLIARMRDTPIEHFKKICKRAGVPYSTALKVRGGHTKNPGVLTVRALEPHFPDKLPGKRA